MDFDVQPIGNSRMEHVKQLFVDGSIPERFTNNLRDAKELQNLHRRGELVTKA